MSIDKLKGRVVEKQYNSYKIQLKTGIEQAKLKGKHFHSIQHKDEFPCVGDWVTLRKEGGLFQIDEIETRRTKISRKTAGNTTEEQVIAANIDYVIIVLGLDGGRNYSDRLLERYTTIAWNSGATPLIVLNKADLNNEAEYVQYQAENIAPGVEVVITSAENQTGIDELLHYLSEGKVGVFIGPSGVGKSTLTNALLKEELQRTSATRDNDKRGRHTTTTSFMFELSNGAYIIDSPGLREVQLWADDKALDDTFNDISALAEDCKFSDCQHEGEPGCAVQAALEQGTINPERYDSYLHLKKELASLNRRKAENTYAERQYDKQFGKMVKEVKKLKNEKYGK